MTRFFSYFLIPFVLLRISSIFPIPLVYAEEPDKTEKIVITGIGADIYKAKQNAIRNAVEQVGSNVSSTNLVKKEIDVVADHELRDKNGRLLGRIKKVGGKLEIRDASGRLKGRYDPKTNETRDASGRLIGKGNLLTNLL